MAGLAIVPSTALAQVSHFLIQLVSRRSLQVQVLYTDLWPIGDVFWKNIFGPGMTGCLGMFHAMKRITDTFRKTIDSDLLQEAMNDFKKCFYSIDPTDLSNVYSALKNGSMSQTGHKYSDCEVQELEKSRFWNKRYGRFLKKITHPSTCIQQLLSNFAANWKSVQDSKSRRLFTETTEKTIKEQFKNITYVCDPPGYKMYREVKAGSNSKHGMSEWHSLRMESQLEKGHHLMAHYGNTGMGTLLADSLIMRGVTETNTKVRFKSCKKHPAVPSHLEDIPLFLDESELAYINQKLQEASLEPIFHGVEPLPPDNGDVFLSEYFFQQLDRNAQGLSVLDTKNNKCICPGCKGFIFPITKTFTSKSVTEQSQSPINVNAAKTNPPRANAASVRASPVALTRKVQQTTKKSKSGTYQYNNCAIGEQTKATPAVQPFFVATSLLPNVFQHVNAPAQCCFPYYPFYCSLQYAWHAQSGPATGQPQPPHNTGCPRQRARGPIDSPFMNLSHP